jgi:hypothetical protein
MSFEPIENYGATQISILSACLLRCSMMREVAVFIQPQLKEKRVRQLYLPDRNILLTRFLAEEGVADLTDCMPIGTDGEQSNEIIRTLAVIRGEVDFKMRAPTKI